MELTQEELDIIFPANRADDFFEALYGEAEDGAYDIKLVQKKGSANTVNLAFELHQRPEKCLACNLTYGLPQVFQRHPIINVADVVKQVAEKFKLDISAIKWELGKTHEESRQLHYIILIITF